MKIAHSFLLSLVLLGGVSSLTACGPKAPKGTAFSEEQLLTQPGPNFVRGVEVLQSPDRKGVVNYSEAYTFFQRSAELGGGPKAHFNAAWAAEMLGQTDDAERHYRKAFEADNTYLAAMFSLTRVYNANDKGDLSVNIYQGYLDNHPDDLDVRTDLIVSLSAAKRFDEAEVQAGEILLRDAQNAAAYRALSAMYYEKGELGMSALCNEKALSLNAGDSGTYNNLGVTALLQGQNGEAIERFKTAIKLNSKGYEANLNLGHIALNSGDYTLAKAALAIAVEANPSSLEAKIGLAVAMRGTLDFDRAEVLYDEVITADKSNYFAYMNASTLHEVYTKDFSKAKSYLQSYIDNNPGKIGPEDPIFARMARIDGAAAVEKARQEEIARKKKEADEREKRNKELLDNMSSTVASYQGSFSKYTDCLDPMLIEEGQMILEQAEMVVEMKDVDMAADIQMMLEGYAGTWDPAIAQCEASGASPKTPTPEDSLSAPDEATPTE